MLRTLRIAVSVVSGLCCVLVIALWVRSYWVLDMAHMQNARSIQTTVGSEMGKLYLAHFDAVVAYKGSSHNNNGPHHWTFLSRQPVGSARPYFVWERDKAGISFAFPHWSVATAAILIGGAVWIPVQFSLRTLLLTTTAIAILLGLIIYTTRG